MASRRIKSAITLPRFCGKVVCLMILLFSVTAGASPLREHPSRYLALHADDPVQWRLLDRAALEEAQRTDRPIFLSSGYFACHWCHVMQQESFRDPVIAAVLNRHFIPVKIDRELAPEEDAYLLAFVQRSRGNAGWPLSVFLTPDGHPLYGTPYVPPAELLQLLQRMVAVWRDEGAEWRRVAAVEAMGDAVLPVPDTGVLPEQLRTLLLQAALAQADELEGGFGMPAKFPHVPRLRTLLSVYRDSGDAVLGAFLRLTLRQMATQGLRDHIGGGFFRYTIDPSWQEPHFEKMLYDSAQLTVLYFEAAALLGEAQWADIGRDTLDFMLRELLLPDGAFAASLSALNAAGEEGRYYLWSEEELRRLLSADEYRVAAAAWGVSGTAEFAAGHLPRELLDESALVQRFGKEAVRLLDTARNKLLRGRAVRSVPRDDKRIAAWNGLALQALALGAQQTDGGHYHQAGARLRDYLVTRLWDGGRLARAADHAGALPGDGVLEDYAQVAVGLLAWAEVSARQPDRQLALGIADAAWHRFRRGAGWDSGVGSVLPLGQAQVLLADGVMSSPGALLGLVAARGEGELWQQRARAALEVGTAQLMAAPLDYASYIAARR